MYVHDILYLYTCTVYNCSTYYMLVFNNLLCTGSTNGKREDERNHIDEPTLNRGAIKQWLQASQHSTYGFKSFHQCQTWR